MSDFQRRFKVTFFDQDLVNRAVERGFRRQMMRWGSLSRGIARRSMRRTKSASRPGEPPRSHKGYLKKFLFFSYSARDKSVVVGPTPLPGQSRGRVPPLLEEGGTTALVPNPRRVERRVGGSGVIDIGLRTPRGATNKAVWDLTWNKKYVTFAKIQTVRQLGRVEALEEEVWGPKWTGGVRMAARPYMLPAGKKAIKIIKFNWKDSIK